MGELERMAQYRLPKHVWDYANGGAGSEATLRRNRAALARLAIEQRVLVDVRNIDLSVDFLGVRLPMPAIVAPMGGLFRFWPQGELEMARGAGRDGCMATVSGVCRWPVEQVAEAATGPLLFQLYHNGPREWVQAKLERVHSCPVYKAVCLTVDVPLYGRRDRDLDNRYGARASEETQELPEPKPPDPEYPAQHTWADVDWLRQHVRLPFGLKGILSAADARIALDHGVDFIWVSNHGGRQLDSARATVEALPDVAEVVAGRVPIVVDGGFTRGSDVVKGLALGATVVAMGKAASWGLAAGGADGIAAMLRIIREETRLAMGLSGHTSMRELTPDVVRTAGAA